MLSPPWECKDHVRSYLRAASLWLLFCLPCTDRKILPLSPTVECSLSLVLCFVAQASRLLCLLFCCPSATSSHCETVTHYRSLLCSFVQLRSISENTVIYTESEKQPFETHHLGLFFLLLLSSLITVSPFFSVFVQVLLHRDHGLPDHMSDHTSLRVWLRHVLCRFHRVSCTNSTGAVLTSCWFLIKRMKGLPWLSLFNLSWRANQAINGSYPRVSWDRCIRPSQSERERQSEGWSQCSAVSTGGTVVSPHSSRLSDGTGRGKGRLVSKQPHENAYWLCRSRDFALSAPMSAFPPENI